MVVYQGYIKLKILKPLKNIIKKTHPDDSNYRVGQVVPQIWNFMYGTKIGDFVIMPLGPGIKTHSSRKNRR